MPGTYRVGVIGCGFFAPNHLNSWNELGVEIAAVCDLDESKAKAAAERFKAARWFTDAATMLHEARPDFVDIITTMPSHRPLVALCARERLPVIVQKPFAPTYADCVAMVDTCKAAGVALMVHENFRFQAPLRRVREVLDRGVIGTPLWCRISFRTGYDIKTGQPYLFNEERFIVLDLGIHVLDIARFYLGEADSVFARHQRVDPRVKGEDMATIMLGHKNGATSIVDFTYESRKQPDLFPQTLVTIEGTKGAIDLGPGFQLGVTANGKLTVENAASPLRSWTSEPWHVAQDSVYHTQAHWLARLSEGREPETSGADNLKTYALAEAAYGSAATGQAVKPVES
ncbi:MAG: Gfo/Idh/MocA family oxidoreductase [Methylobacteriaceae bacterium]|nr:Gfo/Idh/MocA family oxidoreductase [Methylobacteriaceae bacterium]MBV9634473.1 Gfo/Idh/MocA family oxidoreductase [Methylobacteriaceae bacterium]MBV9702100.1 Gfo/Idh/MocA family oxidoreductase [Methylobacteriaceae bacterium]